MSKSLIIYYSLSGKTKKVVDILEKLTNAKTEIKVGNEKCKAKTKGYAGTILTLMLMFTELALAKQ